MSREEAKEAMDDLVSIWPRFSMELKKRNMQPFILANDNHPFFRLSLMRSMVAFTQDLYLQPRANGENPETHDSRSNSQANQYRQG